MLVCGLALASTGRATSFPVFKEVTEEAGITHRHRKPILDSKLAPIMPWISSVGAAAAAGDFNRDGWMDLYVTNSRKGEPNYLYRNNGDGTFTDVAATTGVADLNNEEGTSMDCIWGDYNNDGWIDLYVVRWGRDRLFQNRAGKSFTDVTASLFHDAEDQSGTAWANGNAAIFFDFNLDGRLDLYVGNYFDAVDLWHLKSTRIMHNNFETARNGGRNFLYRQEADGSFTEVAESLGLDDPGWTLAVGAGDLNNDGWVDLYCADDFGPDQLFLNRKDGTFQNISETAIGFDSKKGMNVDMGDFNQDGWLDLYVANITTAEYLQEGNMLWHNNGPNRGGIPTFTDVSLETGTYNGGWGWGAKFFDFDHDTDLDIIAVNGFISAGKGSYWFALASWTVTGQDSADAANWPPIGNRSFSGYEPTRFWRNDGLYAFSERAAELGVDSKGDGRGVVCFDYDNDGDLDIYIANQDQRPVLYQNHPANSNHWIMLDLNADPATGVNADAIGTRLTLVSQSGRQIREREGGNSYCGQSDPRIHFGLGADEVVQLLEIRWPDGGLQYLENLPPDQIIRIQQDPGEYARRVSLAAAAVPHPWKRQEVVKATPPPMDPKDLDRLLGVMENQISHGMEDWSLASSYRKRCADYGQVDRAIRFFKDLVAKKPDLLRPRIELACAYVDKIPSQGGIAAIVSKGTLARKSLDQLDLVLEKDPDSWAASYARGMNHLHWPRALRHSDNAVADFKRCLALQKSETQKPYYVRTFIAMGDAYGKAKQYDEAREAWRQGLLLFPQSQELRERIKLRDDDQLLDYIESKRSLEAPIDTDLSFLDRS